MDIIAHRCGTDKFPELTIDSANYSNELGAKYVELDIRFTKDDCGVINHDDNGNFLFGYDKPVIEMTSNEFLSLRHKTDIRYPSYSLEHFFQSGIKNFLFHIKEGGQRLNYILNMIRKYDCEDTVVLGVTCLEDVKIIKDYNPSIKILSFMYNCDDIEPFADAGVYAIRLWESQATEERIQRVLNTGKKLWIMADKIDTGFTTGESLLYFKSKIADAVLVNDVKDAINLVK